MSSVRANTSWPAGRRRAGKSARASLLALTVVVAAAGAWACRASDTTAGGAQLNITPSAAPEPAARQSPPAVLTTLTPSGFTPNQVSRAAGRFDLKVKNESGEREVTLRLSKEGGEKVTEARLTDKVRVWAAPVDLAAGSYLLSEANHPQWECRITVQ